MSNFGSGFGLAPELQRQEPIPFAPSGAGLAPELRGELGNDADRERRLMDSFRESYNTDPNFAAEAQKFADELGASRATVAANMDVAKRMAVARSLRYQELKDKFPTLLEKFSNVKFASLAHDDIGNLKATESTWEWLGRQGEAGMAANQRGYLGVRRALGWMTPDEQAELDRLNVSMREAGQDSGIAAATAQTLGQMAGTVPLAMGAGAAAAGLASLGGPLSAGAAFTGGTAAAGFSLSAMIEGGNAYEDMLAQGIDKDTAAKAAFGVVAPVNGALEMVGMHYFAAPFKSAFAKLATKKVAGKLVSETAGSAFDRFARSYAKSYLSEIGTEVLQEAVSMSAGGVARAVSRPDLPAMTWADIMGQLGEIAGKTAQGMLLPALPGPAFQFVGDSLTARQSLVEQQFLKDAIAQQGESKVAKRAPNARLEFLAATARGSDGATAYVRTEAALDALRQDGLTIEDLSAKSPEIAAKLNEAREKGLESASFPTATYIGKLQGTTFGETLLPHLRLSEASMSLEELKQFAKDEPKRTAEAAALIEAYKATSAEWAQSSAKVREDYRTSILQAGRSEQEATTVASFLTAFAETQAYGLGITPSEFVARFPLQVVRGVVAAQAPTETTARKEQGKTAPIRAVDYTTRLEYRDIGQPAQAAPSKSQAKYAAALSKESPESVASAARSVRKAFDSIAKELGIDLTDYAASETWSLWDLGKQLHLNANPSQSNAKYRLGNPLTEEAVRRDIVFRHLGWEIAAASGRDGLPSHELTRIGREAVGDRKFVVPMDPVAEGDTFRQTGPTKTDSPAFQAWFSGSKMVDQSGQPLVVYHGTEADFSEFRIGDNGVAYFSPSENYGYVRKSSRVVPAYLSLKSPFVTDEVTMIERLRSDPEMVAELKRSGYDGVAYAKRGDMTKGPSGWGNDYAQVAVFSPTQIKSTQNRGTFSATDPNVLRQTGPTKTNSPEFRNWFGESKVVDEKGKPLVVYHGSRNGGDFEQFRMPSGRGMVGAVGAHFGDETQAKEFGSSRPFWLAIKNPLRMEDAGGWFIRDALFDYVRQAGVSVSESEQFSVLGSADPVAAFRSLLESKGYDGIVYANEVEGQFKEGAYRGEADSYIAFRPEQIKSVNNRGTFDPSDPNILRQGDTKGTFDPKTLTIMLMESPDPSKSANLSTLLHELGHFYLHVLAELATNPEAARAAADFQTFAAWTGVKDVATWNAMSLDEQRPHHEAFARSFEVFLYEGKAPSAELRTLFERFRAWLVSVYRDIVGQLNANYRAEFGRDLPALTPEVRGVMGRLVAADEAIAKAEAVRNMKPLFQTLEESGMTAEEFSAYEQSIAEAHEASVTDLGKASLRQMQWLTGARARLTKQLQSKNEKLRREAEREVGLRVSGEPIYRAIRWLRKGELLNEDGTKAQGDRDHNHRLNRAAVEAMLPGADLSKLEGLTLEQGGLMPDVAAEALGFGSGEAMLKAILEAPTLAERIETEADALMLDRHGDMATPEAREAAVEEALHNEARMRFVATELRWLSKSTEPVRIMVQAAQEAAREAIAALPVRQLTPRTFALAEARSARLAAKEAKAGNMVEAVRAKRQQLLHSHMAAEALRARREVDTAKADFKRFFRPDEKLAKTRNVDFVNAGRAVLAWYGLGPKGDKPPGAYVQALREYNPTLYAEMEPTLARVVDTPRDFRDLTTDEFRALVVTVDALWDASKRSRQITVEGQQRELAEVTGEVLARLGEIGVPEVLPGEKADVTEGQRKIRGIHQIGAALKRVEHWADTLDGGKAGPFTRYVWRPVQQAIDAYRVQRNKVVKSYVDLMGEIEWPQGKIDAPELGYTFGADNGGGGLATLIGAMLHTGNESNFRKLLLPDNRRWGEVDAEGNLDKSRWDAFIARMIDKGILTKRHFDWVQKVWDLTESLKPEAQKAWHDINGVYFKPVEASARTQTFKDGSTATYRGGYVPAKVDGFLVRDADVHQKLAELEADFRNTMPSVPSGFGKSRVEGYTKALSLDVRKIAAHLDSVVRFIHVQPAIRSVLKVVNDRAVSATLSRVDSTAVNDLILPWLNRAAQQQTMEGDPSSLVNRFWNAVRKRTGMSAMFASLSNAMQQLTGYFPAALKVAPRYLKGGLAAYAKDFKGTTEEVAKRSEFMATRLDNQTFEIADAMNDVLVNPTRFDKVKKWSDRHAYFLQSAFQNQVDVVTWLGAYNQSIEAQGAIDPATAEREAVQKADAAVRLTQGSRDPESLARFEASTPFVKLFTQFSGYFNMLANLNASEYRKLFRELGWGAFGRKGAGRLAMLYVLGFGAPTLIADAIAKSFAGKWDDEEGDGYSDDLAQWFFAANAKGAVSLLPGVGPAVNAVIRGVSSASPYDDRMSLAPSITALEAATFGVAKTAENVAQGKLSGRNVRDVLTLLTLLTGVPVSALGKPIGYAMDANAGKFEPTGPVDYGRGMLTGIASEASKR